jgi:hypothetical protein
MPEYLRGLAIPTGKGASTGDFDIAFDFRKCRICIKPDTA